VPVVLFEVVLAGVLEEVVVATEADATVLVEAEAPVGVAAGGCFFEQPVANVKQLASIIIEMTTGRNLPDFIVTSSA